MGKYPSGKFPGNKNIDHLCFNREGSAYVIRAVFFNYLSNTLKYNKFLNNNNYDNNLFNFKRSFTLNGFSIGFN